MDDLLDFEELSRSLNGFDEIAIERYFHKPFHELSATTLVRALVFIAEKRDGMGDQDAFKKVMDMPISALEARAKQPESILGKD